MEGDLLYLSNIHKDEIPVFLSIRMRTTIMYPIYHSSLEVVYYLGAHEHILP